MRSPLIFTHWDDIVGVDHFVDSAGLTLTGVPNDILVSGCPPPRIDLEALVESAYENLVGSRSAVSGHISSFGSDSTRLCR